MFLTFPPKGSGHLVLPSCALSSRTPALGLFPLPWTAVTPLLPVASGLPDLQQPEQTPLRHRGPHLHADGRRDDYATKVETTSPISGAGPSMLWPSLPRGLVLKSKLFFIKICLFSSPESQGPNPQATRGNTDTSYFSTGQNT